MSGVGKCPFRAVSAVEGKCPFRSAMQAQSLRTSAPETTTSTSAAATKVATMEMEEKEQNDCKCVADGLRPKGTWKIEHVIYDKGRD